MSPWDEFLHVTRLLESDDIGLDLVASATALAKVVRRLAADFDFATDRRERDLARLLGAIADAVDGIGTMARWDRAADGAADGPDPAPEKAPPP